jgi:hypothetical protein
MLLSRVTCACLTPHLERARGGVRSGSHDTRRRAAGGGASQLASLRLPCGAHEVLIIFDLFAKKENVLRITVALCLVEYLLYTLYDTVCRMRSQ